MLFVHAGNRIDLADRPTARFAQSEVPMVAARVGQLLATFRPVAVVSAAAAGADLVVLQEAIEQGIAVHVVLPIGREGFVEQSVADTGAEWVQRFDAVMAHVSSDARCSLVEGDADPASAWYEGGHDLLLQRAEALAGGDVIVALTIRPPEGETPPSVSDAFAARAERLGLLTLCIDPRARSASTAVVR
ncbi:MAG TPA: hypothetical protein VFE86_00445 [Ilumatobacteraceae bacterium]|nr:hypothetical protein [Ilumatobacteraceae bacterium]